MIINRQVFNLQAEILTFEDGSKKIAFDLDHFLTLFPATPLEARLMTERHFVDVLNKFVDSGVYKVKHSKAYLSIVPSNPKGVRAKTAIYVVFGCNQVLVSIHRKVLGEAIAPSLSPDGRFPSTERFSVISESELVALLSKIQPSLSHFLTEYSR